MRFIALAMSALGLAGFTVGVAAHEGQSSHFAISPPASTSYLATFPPVSYWQYAVLLSVAKKEASSHYSAPTTTPLSYWHPGPSRSIPTQSIDNVIPIQARGHITERGSLTLPLTTSCPVSYGASLVGEYTNVCTEPARTTSDPYPCDFSLYYHYTCSQTWDWGGRRSRWVAKAAAQSSQDFGSRRSRYVEQVAVRSTQDLGGRGQRAVPRFVEATVTPAPTPVAARAIPTCSFDLSKGEYVCPKAQTALPTCSFDLTKGKYICPRHKVARVAATPAASPRPEGVDTYIPTNEVAPASPCPAGVNSCIPADEREEIAAPAPCPEGVDFCVPRNEVATPTTLETVKS
jgi:hypothetical protein